MTRKNNNIFIACDTPSLSKIKKIINLTKNSSLNIGYKFGLEFLTNFVGNAPGEIEFTLMPYLASSHAVYFDHWIRAAFEAP